MRWWLARPCGQHGRYAGKFIMPGVNKVKRLKPAGSPTVVGGSTQAGVMVAGARLQFLDQGCEIAKVRSSRAVVGSRAG